MVSVVDPIYIFTRREIPDIQRRRAGIDVVFLRVFLHRVPDTHDPQIVVIFHAITQGVVIEDKIAPDISQLLYARQKLLLFLRR